MTSAGERGKVDPRNAGLRQRELVEVSRVTDVDRPGTLPPLLVHAVEIVARAQVMGVCLRLTGSLGIRSHCTERADLFEVFKRDDYGDIDFIGKAKERSAISELIVSLGYRADEELVRAEEFGTRRLIFENEETLIKIDVFLDQLQMCHTLDFRGRRLNLDSPTTALVDLLLAKLQIHDITQKDLVDILVLLAEHPLASGPETIDEGDLKRRLGDDWGFYETASCNLRLALEFLTHWDGERSVQTELLDVVDGVLMTVTSCPKTLRWRLRAKVGRRIPWYQEVEDVKR